VIDTIVIIELPLNNQKLLDLGQIQHIWTHINLVCDTSISRSALHNNICDIGLTYKILQRAAAEWNDDLREEWMEDMWMHRIPHQLVMVDETSKDDWMIYRHYSCAPEGHCAAIHANFMRGEHYSLVVAMSVDGYKAMSIVLGLVDGDIFFYFIVHDVVCPHFPFCIHLTQFFMLITKDKFLPSG
jgi:hypothetical protein